MNDTNPHVERTGRLLTFVSDPSAGTLFVGSTLLVAAVIVFAAGGLVTIVIVAVLVVIGCIVLVSSAGRVLEMDLAARRVRLTRQFLNLRAKTLVDRPFDECRALGIFMQNANGRISCSAYVQTIDSQRHAIPLQKMTYTQITAFVRELSAETGIPFEETPMVEIVQSGD